MTGNITQMYCKTDNRPEQQKLLPPTFGAINPGMNFYLVLIRGLAAKNQLINYIPDPLESIMEIKES